MKQITKKLVLVVIILTMALGIGTSVNAAGVPSPCSLNVKLVNQDPNPAVPNEYVKVLFQVTGLENPECKTGATVKIVTEYPFTLDSDVDSVQSLSGSTFTSGYKTAWMIPYRLRVAPDALQAPYQLKLLSHLGNSTDFSSGEQGSYTIAVADALTDFDTVVQEVTGSQVSVGIVNTGKNTANSLVASIPMQNDFRVVGSTSAQIIGNLAAGDYTIVSFNLESRIQRNATSMKNSLVGQNSAVIPSGNPFANGGKEFQSGSVNTNDNPNQLLKVKLDYTDGIGERRTLLKEIPLNGFILQGNMTGRGGYGQGNRGATTSTTPLWQYAIGLIVIIAGIVYYRRYRTRAQKNGLPLEKNSEHTPSWAIAEKSKAKK